MKMFTRGDGVIVIKGDEELLAKIEGEILDDVDVSDLKVNADTLASSFALAESTPMTEIYSSVNGERTLVDTHDNIKRYAVLKQKYLDTYGN